MWLEEEGREGGRGHTIGGVDEHRKEGNAVAAQGLHSNSHLVIVVVRVKEIMSSSVLVCSSSPPSFPPSLPPSPSTATQPRSE